MLFLFASTANTFIFTYYKTNCLVKSVPIDSENISIAASGCIIYLNESFHRFCLTVPILLCRGRNTIIISCYVCFVKYVVSALKSVCRKVNINYHKVLLCLLSTQAKSYDTEPPSSISNGCMM